MAVSSLTDDPARDALHHVPVHEAVVLMDSDPERGLAREEAARRLERFGPNALPRASGRGWLTRLALQFRHPLIYVLLAAAVVSALVGEALDAGVILGVVLVNAAIGFVQESRAQQALDALAAMVRLDATVIRGGERLVVGSEEVVPGDLVLLAGGEAVAADLRLVEANDVRVDESALTGESLPAHKDVAPVPADAEVADRVDMAFAGTLVTHGSGRGVAVATGAQTELGLIHRLMGEAVKLETPLTRKIAELSRVVMWAILALAAGTYALGLVRGDEPAELLIAVVALAVGAIPEGLPAAVTIVLAVGVSRMARRRAIVRRLPAVETLGSTTVICSDKTGTLTENRMTVQAIVAGHREFAVGGAGDGHSGETVLTECLVAGALCNDAELRAEDGAVEPFGDPTEVALLVAAAEGGIDVDRLAAERPRIDEIPFSAERRFMATVHAAPGAQPAVYVKGAVERVLALCSTTATDAGTVALDADRVLGEADALGARGLRVLALARGPAPDGGLDEGALGGGLELLGLQAMLDPPRPAAVAAVASCRRAGIAVKMITGDHVATARAVAQRVGLGGGGEPAAMTGAEIARCTDAELAVAAARTTVFARVSPEQKLRLVAALQSSGEVVAMTGDGVNDAPALKRADIGVAMGRGGTEVARDAADIVLCDDDFASIEAAVEEGRRAFDNLTKFIVWTLPTNVAEGLLVLVAIATASTLPILPVQILWINMTTAGALGVMLAFERHEPGVMARPPRDPRRPLLTGDLVGRIVLVSGLLLAGSFGLFEWERAHGASMAEARTVAVNVFVAGELFYLLNCRSLERSILAVGVWANRPLLVGLVAAVGLQLAFTYAPTMNVLFDTAAIGWWSWARVVAFGLAVWAVVGIEKRLRSGTLGVPRRPAESV